MRPLALLIALSLAGCATLTPTEAQQLAYTGTGPNVCAWGGVTAKADRHCSHQRGGWRMVGAPVACRR